ncbi:MAG: hypothetical protein WCA44_01390 [Acidobacteriaceae bacterium]|jgi:hypothetical protein
MVSNCANPKCGKPLHYLREGRIFAFEVSTGVDGPNGKRTRRLEHFWLCGACTQTMTVQQSADGIHAVLRTPARLRREAVMTQQYLAS